MPRKSTVATAVKAKLQQLKEEGIEWLPQIPLHQEGPVQIEMPGLPGLSVAQTKPSPDKKAKLSLAVYENLPDPFPRRGQEGLDNIREILGPCTRCKLCQNRNQIVFGQGNPQASLVFVGEGPGAEEDRTGLPFVGAAGDLLTRMIIAMGFQREQVYICNVVKCRPPGNRVPEPDEVFHCGPFLRAQLQAIQPKVIVALGRTPMQFLLQTTVPIGKIRGSFLSYEGVPVMPTYHPAYLLRTPSAKKQVWEDLQLVMAKLKESN